MTGPRPLSNAFPAIPARPRNGTLAPWLALGLSALVLAGCDASAGSQAASAPRPVQVVKVDPAASVLERSYVGTLRARFESPLAFRVDGKLATRQVDTGARVAKGQVLATLDDTDYRLALAAAQAEVAANAARLKQAAADEARSRDLAAKGHVSAASYDQKRAAADGAREALRAAERQRDLAANRLDYTVLRADADGVVTSVLADAGRVMEAGTPVVALARAGEVEAVVAIPEARLGDLRAATAEVSLWADGGKRFPVTLREVSPDADPVTRSYAARFTLPAEALAQAALGMTATVHLDLPATTRAIRLPRTAVVDFGQGPQVWRVPAAGGKPEPVKVAVRGHVDEAVLVEGALNPGDLIVSLGAHRLDAGEAVRVQEVRS